MRMSKSCASIDEYIQLFPKDVQEKLKTLRNLIKETAPDAQEKISYQIPAFYLKGNLVYFAAHTRHIGFYPTASGISNFRKELAKYVSSKGAVQFPMDEPLPVALIKKIVRFRVRENLNKEKKK